MKTYENQFLLHISAFNHLDKAQVTQNHCEYENKLAAMSVINYSAHSRNNTRETDNRVLYILFTLAVTCLSPTAYSIKAHTKQNCHSVIHNETFLNCELKRWQRIKILVVWHHNRSPNIFIRRAVTRGDKGTLLNKS